MVSFTLFKSNNKKALLFLGGSAVVLLLFLLLIFLKPFNTYNKISAGDFMPKSVFFVSKINDPAEIFNDKKKLNIITYFNDFVHIKIFFSGLKTIDSVFNVSKKTENLLSKSVLYTSLNLSEKSELEQVFVLELPQKKSASDVFEEFSKNTNFVFIEIILEKNKCFKLENGNFVFCLKNNFIVGSLSEPALTKSLLTLKNKDGISNNKSFYKSFENSSENCDINIFICPSLILKPIEKIISKSIIENSFGFFEKFSSWSNFDISIRDKLISFSALLPIEKEQNSVMEIFDKPKNNASNLIFSILPHNTEAAISLGFEDFYPFFEKYKIWLDKKYDNKNELLKINKKLSTNFIEKAFYENISGVLCLFSTRENQNEDRNLFCAISINNADSLKHNLKNWKIGSYRSAEIYNLPISRGAFSLFGPMFSKIQNTYIGVCDSFIIISSAEASMKTLLNNILSGRNMSFAKQNNDLLDNMQSSWDAFVYLNSTIAQKMLEKEWIIDTAITNFCKLLNKTKETMQIAITCSNQKNGAIINGVCRFSDFDTGDENNWTTQLDAKAECEPRVIYDTKDKEFWIAVSDVYNNLYLLKSNGDVIWKRKFEDKINADFQLIFEGNAKKRAIAFSTRKAVYVVDFFGNIKKDFPINIKDGILSNLLVVDYDKTKSYRFLFCDNNGEIQNYSLNAKKTIGWKSPKTGNPKECSMFYSKIGTKDFLIASSINNVAQVFNRRGKYIFGIQDIQYNKGNKPFFESALQKSWLGFSKDGVLININEEGKKTDISINSYGENVLFSCEESDIFVIFDGTLYVLNKKGEEKSSSLLADCAIDVIKTVNINGSNFLFFSYSNNLGYKNLNGSDFVAKFKTNISNFDCISHNNKILLFTTQGEKVVSEVVK